METNQNECNEDEKTSIPQGIGLSRPTRKERIRNKAKEIMKIIGSVIGHQLKITLLISAISLVVIILLCSAALYIIQGNDIEALLKMIIM